MKYLIGVDIGTTATKAALFDSEGQLLAEASQESKLIYPRPGWVEQDPEDFYRSTCVTIREIVTKARIDPKDVAALSIDGQMAGVLGIDQNWNAITQYDSWMDTRCVAYVDYIKNNFEDKVLTLSGLPAIVAHCAKILWWKNEKPEQYKRIKKFIQPAAYVAGRLSGLAADKAFIDYTYLHFSGLYDAKTTKWSEELCSDLSVPIEKLPDIVEPQRIIGSITPEASRDCSLRKGTPVAAGAGDQAAGFLGAGLVEKGLVIDVAGTASLLACCVDEYRPDLTYKTLLFPKAASKNLWFPHAFITGGGLCLRWFRDGIIQPTPDEKADFYEKLDKAAADIPPASDSLFFIPHLGGRNFPHNSTIRGVWAGFSWNHDKRHFYRSMMESIAYEYYYYLSIEKDLFPEVTFKEVRVLGGGSKSALFNQIKANVLGLPYVKLSREDVSVLGSAIIAGHSVGIFNNVEEPATQFISIQDRIEPDMRLHDYYKDYAQLYMKMFDILQPFYDELSRVSSIEKPS
jgi:xylulokinase